MPQTTNDQRIKHLEFVQAIIDRLSQNAFVIKGWTITLVSALIAVSTGDGHSKHVLYAAIGAVAVFWLLDSYYTSLERRYRDFYEKVRLGKVADFDLRLSVDWSDGASQFRSLLAVQNVITYGSLAVVIGVVYAVL